MARAGSRSLSLRARSAAAGATHEVDDSPQAAQARQPLGGVEVEGERPPLVARRDGGAGGGHAAPFSASAWRPASQASRVE